MNKLIFGTAGIPVSTQGDNLQDIRDVKKLGLDALELKFQFSGGKVPKTL